MNKKESFKIIVNLASFTDNDYDKGASKLKIILWYIVNALIVRASWNPFMAVKILLLKAFGAKIGKKLVIKNDVTIKYPWKLTIGDNCWIGEHCWIDNIDIVKISNNVCISQGAMLLTGNHDYTISSMPYKNAPIILEDGVWVGAKAIVCPGVIASENSVLTVGSIATKTMEPYGIYQGNPAIKIKERIIKR
jgi:putative colanic acid biosynthesis acetyltransferase WcaF